MRTLSQIRSELETTISLATPTTKELVMMLFQEACDVAYAHGRYHERDAK